MFLWYRVCECLTKKYAMTEDSGYSKVGDGSAVFLACFITVYLVQPTFSHHLCLKFHIKSKCVSSLHCYFTC